MAKNQTGFVPGIGTQVNITQILSIFGNARVKDHQCALFIDLKSAYNTVDRQKLYAILRQKSILENSELEFLKALHSIQYFTVLDKTYWYRNGVPQGSPLSPALFDIYMEEFTEHLQILCKTQIKLLLYADDMVIIVNSK
jgi:hypothetical protein